MAKGGFFDNLWGKIGELLNYLQSLAQAVIDQIELTVNVKAVVQEDMKALVEEWKLATERSLDFADRVKNLRAHAIRADTIFEFVDDIRTGALRDWVETEIGSLQSTFSSTLEEISTIGSQLHILRNPATGLINWIVAIRKVWVMIDAVVQALHKFTPILQEINDKLATYEDVIMPQTNPRIRLKKTISARQGKLHH